MGICPNCGSWVDEGDICMSCGGSGSYSHDDEEEDIDSNDSRRDTYSRLAWNYYMDSRETDALHYINMALDLDDGHSENWNIKGIILEDMKRYAESERCYNRSLELSKRDVVCDNKARMLFSWANQLLEESKDLPDGRDKLEEAEKLILKSIKALSADSDENIEQYLRLRDSIKFYIGYENRFRRNLETLKGYDKSELFTITGRKFYNTDVPLPQGMPLKLVKEPDNEFDRDAIAVYVLGEKIGYVANSDNTKYELTSSASELQDKIGDVAQGSYLFYLERYVPIQFYIGIITDKLNLK